MGELLHPSNHLCGLLMGIRFFCSNKSVSFLMLGSAELEEALQVGFHVMCLDFCKAFDSAPHNILAINLDTYVFDRWIY